MRGCGFLSTMLGNDRCEMIIAMGADYSSYAYNYKVIELCATCQFGTSRSVVESIRSVLFELTEPRRRRRTAAIGGVTTRRIY